MATPQIGGAHPDIPVRRVDFAFDPKSVPRAWYHDDLYLSALWSSLSLVFPEGERFFVESVKHYRDRIDDPELRARVAAFIGQEAMHGKEHRAFNEMFRAQGYDMAAPLEAHIKRLLIGVRKSIPPKAQLAVTCALEHFTATLAEQLMQHEEHREAIHSSVQALWLWHALEECEHKSVAFDVYREVSGGYALRVGAMALATVVFLAEITHIHTRFLASQGILGRPRAWLAGLDWTWRKPGIFLRVLPAYFDYYRPSFHPNDRDTDDLKEQFRARLFGEGGPLHTKMHPVRARAA